MAQVLQKRERDTGHGTRACAQAVVLVAATPSERMVPVRRIPVVPRSSRGFTLLEMLAVIVLIGIIGTIVVRSVSGSVDKGKYGAGKTQLTTLSQDVDGYALDNGTPPQQLEDLVVKPANAQNWHGPYAKESALKDPWGHEFGYKYPGDHGNYDLIFFGQDGKPGGDGYNADVGNWQ